MRDRPGSLRRSATFADLLAAARDGRSWAVEELADRYLPRLVSFARARGASDPEGIADVVLLSVLRRLEQLDFEAPEQFWAYLCLAARSRIIDEHRAARPVEPVGDAATLDGFHTATRSSPPGAGFDEVVVDRDYLTGLLSPLTDEQRQVLELRFLADLSLDETAHRTCRSRGAIKGLQRRAINAILAAAVAVLVLILLGLGWRNGDTIDSGPAERGESTPDQPPEVSTGGPDLTGGEEQGIPVPAPASTVPLVSPDPVSPEDPAGAEPAGERFTVTVGSARATRLDTSGRPGPEANHGVRIPCVASHASHDDPVRFPGQPAAAPASIYWGNTAADATSGAGGLAGVGNGTCEGGVTDRSAYWMPALFDEDDQLVVPESVLVEYKTFGGPGFDRSTIRPIPAGLQLLADPAVRGGADRLGPPTGDPASVRMLVVFPTCVEVDPAGQPVLASVDHVSHLAYPSDGDGRSDGCPASHPYRIPQLSFTVTYPVPFGSGWYLAPGGDAARGGPATGAAISAWDPDAMAAVVACVRDLLRDCWFGPDGDGGSDRDQLPERFAGPDGGAVYAYGMTLADGADPTPFGTSVSAGPPG